MRLLRVLASAVAAGGLAAPGVPAGATPASSGCFMVCLYSVVRGLADALNCDPSGTGTGTLAASSTAAPNNLVLIDSGGWASDPHSWNYWYQFPQAAQQDPNIVWVAHYYDCQDDDSGKSTAACRDTSPETQTTITKGLQFELEIAADQHAPAQDVGLAQPRPMVLDEFGWPFADTKWHGPVTETVAGQTQTVQYNFIPDNKGDFTNNVIYYLTSHEVGYAVFAWGGYHLGENVWQGPYELVGSALGVPYSPNVDGAPFVAAYQNPSSMTWMNPPAGDDTPTTPFTG